VSEAAAVPTFFCPECGRKVGSDEKFCRVCGKVLHEGESAGVPSPASLTPPPPSMAAAEAANPAKLDPLLGVRVVLLIGAGVSAFMAPMFITLILVVAWLVVMFLPTKPAP
jgi:zinc-ribbon domain